MRRRATLIAGVVVLVLAFGLGVNRYLAATKRVDQINDSSVTKPTESTVRLDLPFPMLLVQRGQLYTLDGRRFSALTAAPAGQWMHPTRTTGGQIVAVLRGQRSSDLYLLDGAGRTVRQLTHDDAGTVAGSHWVFWPRAAPDGTLFVSYDQPKNGYQVDLAVWSGTLDGPVDAQRWTAPNPFTGGDVHATPLPSGGIVYSRYEIESGRVFSRVVVQTKALGAPVPLTEAKDDCDQPAPSPDGTDIVMVCSSAQQTTRLVMGHVGPGGLVTQHVLVPSCLCASPSWAPDGSGVAFIAPGDAGGHFQLWWLPRPSATSTTPPIQVTDRLDLDATSAPAWMPRTSPTCSPPAHC